jgi:hypothetical protein
MKFEIEGKVFTVHPLAVDRSIGIVKLDGVMVAGYSYGGEGKGFHVQAARFSGEVRGSRLEDCCRRLLCPEPSPPQPQPPPPQSGALT